MANDWENDVATLNKSKSGNLYIKIDKELNLKPGDTLTLRKKADEIDASVSAGKITEEKGEELKEKLHFIKYSIHKPPRNND